MKILKFGGTSVGTAERFKHVARLLMSDKDDKIVVLSATAGTTDTLESVSGFLHQKNIEAATDVIYQLKDKYIQLVRELFSSEEFIKQGLELIESHFKYILSFTIDMFTVYEEKTITAQGELISTALMHLYLKEQNTENILLPALNFMKINGDSEPNYPYIIERLNKEIEAYPNTKLFITQGYICRNAYGEIDNLKRGGSDYTASIIGMAVKAEEIQIWTDIDGMHNNDPRYVENTRPVSTLSFDEAAELAYFGAKILHPSGITPAKISNIPVLLKNTLEPDLKGTLISNETESADVKAVAAKDAITVIKIKSGRMLLAYGFLRKVFEIFEIYKTPIDMITTSEVAVSLTIDNTQHIDKIENELKKFGTVEIERDMTIVCVVGNFIADGKGKALRIFEALKDVPVRMISYGGSKHNVSILVRTSDKINALQLLHNHLF